MSDTQLLFRDLGGMPLRTRIDEGFDGEHDEDDPCEPCNIDRAEWVMEALGTFYNRCYGLSDEPADMVIYDFLGDLMHLCRMNGLDFDLLLDRGRRFHDEEQHQTW